MLFLCFQTFAQDIKSKSLNGEGDRAAIEISVVGNRIYIENAPVGKRIEILSILGLKVSESEIKTSSGEYILNVPKGYYILRIKDTDTIRKIAVR